jgi:hypothetical protein
MNYMIKTLEEKSPRSHHSRGNQSNQAHCRGSDFKSLRFKNRKGAIFHSADWIAGVDYNENIQQEDDYDKDYDKEDNEDPDEDMEDNQYDQIHEDELEDLNKDAREEDNPNQHQEQDKIEHDAQDDKESEDEGTAVISELESDSQTRLKSEGLQGRANQWRNSNQT